MTALAGVAASWLAWAASVSLQFAVLAAVLWLLDRALRRHLSATARLAAWSLVAMRLVLPASWFTGDLGVLPAPLVEPAAAVDATTATWCFVGWIAGALALALGTFAARRRHDARLASVRSPADAGWNGAAGDIARRLGLRAVPVVAFVAGDGSPSVVGVVRPWIAVPRAFAKRLSPAERVDVLAHELTHVRARDPALAFAAHLLRALFWFHPVVWFVVARLATLRELACDERAVRLLGDDGRRYRLTLSRCASMLLDRDTAMGATAWLGRDCAIVERLAALRTPRPRSRGRSVAAAAGLLATLLVACAPLATSPGDGDMATIAATDLSQLPGCLLKRFAVFAAIAAEREHP